MQIKRNEQTFPNCLNLRLLIHMGLNSQLFYGLLSGGENEIDISMLNLLQLVDTSSYTFKKMFVSIQANLLVPQLISWDNPLDLTTLGVKETRKIVSR